MGASAEVVLACAAARASEAAPGLGVDAVAREDEAEEEAEDATIAGAEPGADAEAAAGPDAIAEGKGAATATGCTAPGFVLLGFSGACDRRAITTPVC